MKGIWKRVLIVLLLAGGLAGVLAAKYAGQAPKSADRADTRPTSGPALPRLVDIGMGKCTQCKIMNGIMKQLQAEYAGKLKVEWLDFHEDVAAVDSYGIWAIPAQVFLAPDGKTLFSHEGPMSKESIRAKWTELGYDLGEPLDPSAGTPGQEPAPKPSALQSLTKLSEVVETVGAVALVAAFVWGILSVVLSPCHLSSIPLIVGFMGQQGRMSTRRALAISTSFSVGILITIAAIGAITAAAGRLVGDLGSGATYFVAGIFFLVGLHLLDVIPMPWSGPGQVGMKRRGPLAALILGLVFGVALGPCTFAYMVPVLAAVFKVAAARPIYAASLLAVYGVGHCLVIVVAGTSAELVQRYLNWNEKSKGAVIVKQACGVLVLAGGLWLVYTVA